jgi:uncharacterized membrane protein
MDYLLAWIRGLTAFFGLVFLLFWAITRLTKALMPGRGAAMAGCRSVLEERLTRGEISKAEFDEARRILGDR